jgi:FtsH-binding integral membrane protein
MYTLMNGLTVAFALGATFILGWAVSGTAGRTPQRFSLIFVGFGLVEAILVAAIGLGNDPDTPMARARLMVGFLMVALLASGYVLGLGKVLNVDHRERLGAIALVCTLASLLCYSAFKYFTRTYAETIYRAFNLYEKPIKAAAPTGSAEENKA